MSIVKNSVMNLRIVSRIKWKKNLFGKPANFAVGIATVILVILIGFWINNNQTPELITKSLNDQVVNYPIIEKVDNPNVTVMTYLTDDPKIKIVWLFED